MKKDGFEVTKRRLLRVAVLCESEYTKRFPNLAVGSGVAVLLLAGEKVLLGPIFLSENGSKSVEINDLLGSIEGESSGLRIKLDSLSVRWNIN